jgi:hypothetical protein
VVLAQPHRRKNNDQLLECPLGRLILRHKLRREIYAAGLQYGHKVRQWQAVSGVPVEIHASSGKSSGEGPKAATVRRWGIEISRIDKALKEISVAGFSAVRMLAVFEREIVPDVEEAAVACLTELAIQLSMLRRVAPPFCTARPSSTAPCSKATQLAS